MDDYVPSLCRDNQDAGEGPCSADDLAAGQTLRRLQEDLRIELNHAGTEHTLKNVYSFQSWLEGARI